MTSLMPRLFGDLTGLFDRDLVPAGQVIRVEDYIEDGRYVVRAEMPGMDPDKDVTVKVHNGLLTIDAERRVEEHDKHRTEFRYGSFHRTVAMPAGADEEKVTAGYDNGILTVTVPLATPKTPAGRSVPITKG